MAKDSSFDIVSKVNLPEVSNAVQQAQRELSQRFDFKNSKSSITLEEEKITLVSDDDFKLKNVVDILESKLVKRGISLKALDYGKPQPAAGNTLRQEVKMVQGIAQDKAKEINKVLKDSKIKVVSSIQGDEIRVSGKTKTTCKQPSFFLKKRTLESSCNLSITDR